MAMRFVPFHLLGDTPNVVVDGGPSPSTALVLSHWPGSPTPVELRDDLSAQIALRALDRPAVLDGLEVVSNNHFDQDGLASVFALVEPALAARYRHRLVDLARAGDFATFADRDSIRLAFALAAWDDPVRSPLDAAVFDGTYDDRCGRLYATLVPRLPELLDDVDALRPWWGDEDAHLTESLDGLAAGVVTVEERPDLDLAVVTVPERWAERMTTRFTVGRADALHPAAVHAVTERFRVAVVQGDRYRVECRYESWVMYRSRPVPPRPDLRALADLLQAIEPGTAVWRADKPSALTPSLRTDGDPSGLAPAAFVAALQAFLATAPPAWDPEHPTW